MARKGKADVGCVLTLSASILSLAGYLGAEAGAVGYRLGQFGEYFLGDIKFAYPLLFGSYSIVVTIFGGRKYRKNFFGALRWFI